MISPIHYIIIHVHYIICQSSEDFVYVLMTGLFAWISHMFKSIDNIYAVLCYIIYYDTTRAISIWTNKLTIYCRQK